MEDVDQEHNKCYRICPELPYSYCMNFMITLLFIIFLPVLLLLVPLIYILVGTLIIFPIWAMNLARSCIVKVIVWILCFLVLMPICLAIGMSIAGVVAVIAILPCYFYSFSFLIRLCVIGCRTKV